MISGIDHVVILAQNLDHAIESYRKLGFQVARGGEHPGGTHNALVGFANGTYLELIAFQEPDKPSDHRWYSYLSQGGGLVDFALGASDVQQEVERLHGQQLEYRGPMPGARKRPDGQEIAWRMAWPPEDRAGDRPFLIDDITPRDLRVPSGDAAKHENGVTGVSSLIIAVRDLDEASREFAAITGGQPSERVSDAELQADTRSFKVGGQTLVLAYPTSPRSPIADRIQQKGDGPFQAVFSTTRTDLPRVDPHQAEGARLAFISAD